MSRPETVEEMNEEADLVVAVARLIRGLEGAKDWAARSGAIDLEQWCSEALSPTGKLDVFPPTAVEDRLCYCACCCQTPTGYRTDDERAECTCKVPAPDPDPKGAKIKALADALRRIKGYLPDFEDGPAGVVEAEIDAALRLVGRTP